MRGICFVLILLGVPAIAAAQHQRSARPGRAAAAVAQPLPALGLPLPPLGLSRPPVAEQRPTHSGSRRDGHQRDWQQREWQQKDWLQRDGRRGDGKSRGFDNSFRHQTGLGSVYVGPLYPYAYPYPYVGMPSVVAQGTTYPGVITVVPEPTAGWLRLEVEPADILQVFVDGAYVGTPAHLGSELELQPGSRRIEFRAPGYRSLTIDAQIVSGRAIVYRATLDRIGPTRVLPPPPAEPMAPPAPAPPPGSRTMCMIPGCYMGNVAPQDLKLPAGCDLSRLTTIRQ